MGSEKKTENETVNKASIRVKLCYFGLFVLTGVLTYAFSYLTGKSYEAVLRNTIVSMIITGTVVYMLLDAISRGREGFSYDNYDHKQRFIVVYAVGLLLACSFSFVPDQFWPYMALFVILGLFSNTEIGLFSGTGLVIISVMLEEKGSYSPLFMYVIAGTVALALLRDLKEDTAIGFPTAIALMIQAVLLVAFNVLFQNRTLSFNLLILPILNLMLNLIIIMVFLNMFGVYVIRRSNDMYMEINDSEYHLLAGLRENHKDEYFRAIHTAYLAERIALGLGLNDRAVKTCSYYHRVGAPDNKTSWEDVAPIYKENNFPLEAIEFLHEVVEPEKGKIKSAETLAVGVSESVIASIMYLIKQNKDAKINYDQLIDSILDKKINEGELIGYNITYRQYDQIRKILKKEKLYYDFLR